MFVVDLKELATNGNLAVLTETNGKKDLSDDTYAGEYYFSEFSLDDNGFISDPISVDWNLDFTTDAVYFGTVNFDGTDWGGKLRRIVIDNDPDFTNWNRDSTLIDLSAAAIALSEDSPSWPLRPWVWTRTDRNGYTLEPVGFSSMTMPITMTSNPFTG